MNSTRRLRGLILVWCGVSMAVIGQLGCAGGGRNVAKAGTASPAAASEPSSQRVLLKLGDKETVKQGEVERFLCTLPPEQRRAAFPQVLSNVLNGKMVLLYLQDHPDLVTPEDLDKEIQVSVKKAMVKDVEALKSGLAVSGVTWEEALDMMRIRLVQGKLARSGEKWDEDKEFLKKTYEANPDHFNGATVKVRHILIAVPLTATPAERKARRAEIAKIREDLVSGKKTWDECVQLSNCTSRFDGGVLGSFKRHLELNESLMKVAWSLPIGTLSDIIESGLGYHLIEVMERKPGRRDLSDPHALFEVKASLHSQPMEQAYREVQRKYPLIGVQPPDMAAILAMPAPATRPVFPPPRTTRPASRPGLTTRPAVRPPFRPTTRPGAMGRPPVYPGTRPSAVAPKRPERLWYPPASSPAPGWPAGVSPGVSSRPG
jgi:hypothetical protein